MEDLAHNDAAGDQVLAGGIDVVHSQRKASGRSFGLASQLPPIGYRGGTEGSGTLYPLGQNPSPCSGISVLSTKDRKLGLMVSQNMMVLAIEPRLVGRSVSLGVNLRPPLRLQSVATSAIERDGPVRILATREVYHEIMLLTRYREVVTSAGAEAVLGVLGP